MKNESIYTSLHGNMARGNEPFFRRKFPWNLLRLPAGTGTAPVSLVAVVLLLNNSPAMDPRIYNGDGRPDISPIGCLPALESRAASDKNDRGTAEN